MKGVGVWRVQGQISCNHAAFVQNFLIEYKNMMDCMKFLFLRRVHWSGLAKILW